MKKWIIIPVVFVAVVVLGFFINATCSERIGVGNAGIKVNLYGDDKGVDPVTEVTGKVWYNPWTTEIYEFPLYVQNAIFTADRTEGSPTNDELRVTTKNSMEVRFDVSVNYRIDQDKVSKVFKKYRRPLNELSNTVMRNYIRDGFSRAAADYTAEDMYKNRNEFVGLADSIIRTSLVQEGFIIEKVVLLNSLRLPKAVTEAINSTVKAEQIAQQKRNELAQAKADADKRIAEARGTSESMLIQAKAEAEAYRIKNKELTKLIIQQQFIEKWNGELPQYGTVPQIFRDISSK
ncbi:hypothetical protein FUAX_35740 [Fulvitalea axinellae]|uniref:Band 7 domain-containing protein n=1 Tax=Fulvitalea axinellae TaxID=1182444 RepID=A0AAU9CT16_9BACT|nr:hypothetical protein FUAX_35740 [Fulvitalea axinellae]